ncbi:hypothetical protein EYZ11_001250 [Aspergillus tanneri]|uniref:Uncharacterized protein n=1 Tax=Aspergillus tanneri TaxID=1220188 RepID=A0A4S3JV25_9EURO|nr:hypothetical protein EYZ11_001250 [Aspergillus tanneri]
MVDASKIRERVDFTVPGYVHVTNDLNGLWCTKYGGMRKADHLGSAFYTATTTGIKLGKPSIPVPDYNIHGCGDNDETLAEAIMQRNVPLPMRLLSNGAKVNETSGSSGTAALMTAVFVNIKR